MFCPILLLFLVSVILNSYCTANDWIKWSHEHENCNARLVINVSTLTPRMGFDDTIRCEEASYMKYFKSILVNPPSEFHRVRAEIVSNLYQDLKEARIPVKVPFNGSYLNVHPISFAIPEEYIVTTVPPKSKPFGKVIPGDQSTYSFGVEQEHEFFNDMSKSYFVLTYKKVGWDCLRHYEILASGSLPLFLDIQKAPLQTLTMHPKKLYKHLLEEPALKVRGERKVSGTDVVMAFQELALDIEKVDPVLYSATVLAILQYTRNVLSTVSVAKYLLETIYQNSQGMFKSANPRSVLYLTHEGYDGGDYQVDLLLHGLKKLLGEQTILDVPFRRVIHKIAKEELNARNYFQRKQRMYGKGFTYAQKIDSLHSHSNMNPPNQHHEIQRKIIHHKFDLIIVASAHRNGALHYWDLVCKHYHPLEVAIIDGGDEHTNLALLTRYRTCGGHLFSREGFSERPHGV